MSDFDDLIEHAERYADERFPGMQPLRPARALAVVACMDSRMDIFGILGLHSGDAHVIRNAGGVVTNDVVRSLVLSQRFMGTQGIILLHHTDCGLMRISEDKMREELERETGQRPSWSFEAFSDPYTDVRQSIVRIHHNPFVLHKDDVRGFVYDVESGHLHEVDPT